MFIAVGIIILLGIVFGPQLWVKSMLARHGVDRSDIPGTGGELAKHLVERYGLDNVIVEETDMGDHYNPETKAICLSEKTFHGFSVTAVAVAAHEFGHALQDANGEVGLKTRQRLATIAMASDKIASVFFLAAPLLAVVARSPIALFGLAAIGIALLGVRVLVHLVTLPVEYDASFSKALPILKEGGYLKEEDMPAARGVLKAAALTYVSGALMSLLDLARWVRVLR
ncbi:MAG: zinc metallopeptidase [Pseudomonadota bacterium]